MTSILTREHLHERARENVKALKMASRQTAFGSIRDELLADLQLAEYALAAMDSEPVAEVVSIYGDLEAFGEREIRPLVGIQQMPYGTKLYRHAQPTVDSEPVMFCSEETLAAARDGEHLLRTLSSPSGECVIPLYTTPQPIPEVDSEPVAYIFKHPAGRLFWALTDESNKGQSDVIPVYAAPQPAPVVQPVMFIDGDISTEDADKLAKVIREFNEEDERPLAKMARIIRENPHPTNECDMPKAQRAPVTIDERAAFNAWNNEDNLPIAGVGAKNAAWLAWQARARLGSPPAPVVPDKMTYQDGVLFVLNNDMSSIERGTVAMRAWNACRAAMLNGGNDE